MNTYSEEIKILKAVSHPTRIAILEILRNGEECVCHIEAVLGLRQAYISQHLMVLRKAGIVVKRRNGWNIYYRVLNMKIYDLLDTVYNITGATRSAASLIAPRACSCPQCAGDDQGKSVTLEVGKLADLTDI